MFDEEKFVPQRLFSFSCSFTEKFCRPPEGFGHAPFKGFAQKDLDLCVFERICPNIQRIWICLKDLPKPELDLSLLKKFAKPFLDLDLLKKICQTLLGFGLVQRICPKRFGFVFAKKDLPQTSLGFGFV